MLAAAGIRLSAAELIHRNKPMGNKMTNNFLFADAEFEAERKAVVAHLRRFILRQYGPRCEEFEAGCPVCEMWARHYSIRDYVCD
jgi:hypothetical protein